MQGFSAKTVLITGAASGIGAALAIESARRGMHLVVCDRDAAPLQELAERLEAGGALSVRICVFDVLDVAATRVAVESVLTEREGIDLLFCNAGILSAGRLWEGTDDALNQVIDVNLKGVLNTIRACVPAMLARKERSRLVITGSMGGFIPSPMLGAYSASKAALAVIAETLHFDLQAIGAPIDVSFLAPGAVRTAIFSQANPSQADSDASGASFMEALRRGSAQVGMDPAVLAVLTFEAIEAGQFWIFPHPEMLPAVSERLRTMLAGKAPNFDFQRSFRRPGSN
ncbi:MAG: SDR family NAD(P)-dependent oxidoreductase [Steroidobacteraceae bacterium]